MACGCGGNKGDCGCDNTGKLVTLSSELSAGTEGTGQRQLFPTPARTGSRFIDFPLRSVTGGSGFSPSSRGNDSVSIPTVVYLAPHRPGRVSPTAGSFIPFQRRAGEPEVMRPWRPVRVAFPWEQSANGFLRPFVPGARLLPAEDIVGSTTACECVPPEHKCQSPSDCCPGTEFVDASLKPDPPATAGFSFFRDFHNGITVCQIQFKFTLKIKVCLPRVCPGGHDCPTVRIAFIQFCKKEDYLCFCSPTTLERKANRWYIPDFILDVAENTFNTGGITTIDPLDLSADCSGAQRRDVQGQYEACCKTISMTDAPRRYWDVSKKQYLAGSRHKWFAFMFHGDSFYETYTVYQCKQCKDSEQKCRWYALAVTKWHIHWRATLRRHGDSCSSSQYIPTPEEWVSSSWGHLDEEYFPPDAYCEEVPNLLQRCNGPICNLVRPNLVDCPMEFL